MGMQSPGVLAGKRIGVFGKGGSGKSTVTILLAKVLRALDYEVAILDADSTNVGLSAALGLELAPQPLIGHFGGMVFGGGFVTCPVDDPTRLPDASLCLARIPDGLVARTTDGIFLLVAGKIGHRGPGAGCDGPISKIARDLRLRGNGDDPVTLVDFKAGFEDSARGVITGLDWAVVVVDPNLAAVQMAADMKKTVERIRAGALPATRHLDSVELVDLANSLYREARIKGVLCVLNKIPDGETERVLRARLASEAIDPVGVIHTRQSIGVSWLQGEALDEIEAQEEARNIAEKLEAAEAEYSRETVNAS